VQEKQRWLPMVFVLMVQNQCWVLWKMTIGARPNFNARHMLRTARPLLRQVQHCLPLALAARGGSSSGNVSTGDAALHAVQLQYAVIAGVLAVALQPGVDNAGHSEVAWSDELVTAALQHLLAACALLHKQAEQQQQQLPPKLHASLLHLLPGGGDGYAAALQAHAAYDLQHPATTEEEAEYASRLADVCISAANLLRPYSLARCLVHMKESAAVAAGQHMPLSGVAATEYLHLTVELQLLAAARSGGNLGQLLTSSNGLLLQQLHEVYAVQQGLSSLQQVLQCQAGRVPQLLLALAAPMQHVGGSFTPNDDWSAGEQLLALRAALDMAGCRLDGGEEHC
jgi:hypothetical protein